LFQDTVVKKYNLLFWFVFAIAFLVGGEYIATVSAQPQDVFEDSLEPVYRLSPEASTLYLTSSNAYTIYLPLIFVPPPPSSKKGVGVKGASSVDCADVERLRSSWYLRWSPDPACSGADERFVPRISDGDDMLRLSQAIANAQSSGWLIGFTEPNLPAPGHADLSPAEAAVLWRQIEQAADPAGIKLVSPSPSQHEPGWLWAMVDEYRARYGGANPRFDAIGWNIYKPTAGEIKTYLTSRHNEALARGYNVPIWVLEYGGHCQGTMASNITVMSNITPWFDSTSWIGRYAWFANRLGYFSGYSWHSCSLIDISTGEPTSLGYTYWYF
jgi:hypothetical protein